MVLPSTVSIWCLKKVAKGITKAICHLKHPSFASNGFRPNEDQRFTPSKTVLDANSRLSLPLPKPTNKVPAQLHSILYMWVIYRLNKNSQQESSHTWPLSPGAPHECTVPPRGNVPTVLYLYKPERNSLWVCRDTRLPSPHNQYHDIRCQPCPSIGDILRGNIRGGYLQNIQMLHTK